MLFPKTPRFLVKVSGFLCHDPASYAFVAGLYERAPTAFVRFIPGGGIDVDAEFRRRGLPIRPRGPMGREMPTFEEREAQRSVIEDNASFARCTFAFMQLYPRVTAPYVDIDDDDSDCPQDGDEMVRILYDNYDEIFILCTKDEGRAIKKVQTFAQFPKVTILHKEGDDFVNSRSLITEL